MIHFSKFSSDVNITSSTKFLLTKLNKIIKLCFFLPVIKKMNTFRGKSKTIDLVCLVVNA